MLNGFGMNSGVPRGGARINPEGVRPDPTPALPVPGGVPFVQPANNGTKFEPDQGALALARAMGNIDFGALGRGIGARAEARRKLRDAQDEARGIAETSQLLAQTGSDYETLVQTGKIPASATPAFRLGASIAAAQHELIRLREGVQKRAIENPNAPVFTEDPTFMAQFYSKLQGVRSEAVVKYFNDPLQELAADDVKRRARAYDVELQQKFMGDTLGVFEGRIRLGESPGLALNDALNKLKLSGQLNKDLAKEVLAAATTELIAQSTDSTTGRFSLSKASEMLQGLGDTTLAALGGRMLRTEFATEFMKLQSLVYAGVSDRADAATKQREAQQAEAEDKWHQALVEASDRNPDGTLKLPSVEWGIQEAERLGLDVSEVPAFYKSWDGVGGNVSASEAVKMEFKAAAIDELNSSSPEERDAYFSSLAVRLRSGEITHEEYLTLNALRKEYEQKDAKSPITGTNRKHLETTLENRLQILWDGSGFSHTMNGSTLWKPEQAPRNVARQLTDMAITWAQGSPLWGEYLSATKNVDVDPTGPVEVLDRVVEQFLLTNRDSLRDGISRALTSPKGDPVGELSRIRLGTTTQRVYQAPAKPAKSTAPTRRPAAPTNRSTPKPATPAPVGPMIKKTNSARLNIMNTNSAIFAWYAADVKRRNPKLSNEAVMRRVRNLPPSAIRQLQELYERQSKGGANGQ